MTTHLKIFSILCLSLVIQSCGAIEDKSSTPSVFLEGGGWEISESPYNLPPGATIGICDTEGTGKFSVMRDAVRIWLKAGGRDERLHIVESCASDRVIYLNKLTEEVDFYGRAHPLTGNVYNVDVAPQWAGRWTANHEVGHIFGFGHKFDETVSIMNSDENGKYMNGGELSDYDRSEIKHLLSLSNFSKVNALWRATVATPASSPLASPPPSLPIPRPVVPSKSCLGADGQSIYRHGTVTTYQGNTYTCKNGNWIFSAGIE